MNSGIAKLESVRDDRGHRWAASVLDDERLPQLIVGTKVHIETAATGNVMYGFAVGDDTVAVSEWGDNGNFELHVLERYEGKTLVLHVAVRRHGTQGKTNSDWLGEVDDLWVIQYQVAAAVDP